MKSERLGEEEAEVPPVDERVPPRATDPVTLDRPPRWYRRLWLFFVVVAVGLVLLAVGGTALMQVDSVDSDTDAFRADAEVDAALVASLETDIRVAQSRLDELGRELTAIQEQRAALTVQTDEMQGSAGDIGSQAAEATASLEVVGSDAVAFHHTMEEALARLNDTLASEAATARNFLAGVEAGNRRQIDTMTQRLGAGTGALRVAVDREEAAFLALRLMLFQVGGTTSDGVLATEAFDDPQSGWTVTDNADGAAGYVDGGYLIVAEGDAAVMGFMLLEVASIGIEVDAEVSDIRGVGDYEYGIMCRAQETSDTTEGYLLSVGATHVRIGVFDRTGTYRELTPWQDVLAPTSGTRRLAAVCDGDRIALLVDGESVAETTAIGLDGAAVGLFAVSYGAEQVAVRFDDLRLVHPSVVGGGDGG